MARMACACVRTGGACCSRLSRRASSRTVRAPVLRRDALRSHGVRAACASRGALHSPCSWRNAVRCRSLCCGASCPCAIVTRCLQALFARRCWSFLAFSALRGELARAAPASDVVTRSRGVRLQVALGLVDVRRGLVVRFAKLVGAIFTCACVVNVLCFGLFCELDRLLAFCV